MTSASVDAVLANAREYLFLQGVDHVLVSLAVAVSAAADGPPLWAMLVGPPSGGKSEALDLLAGVADDRLADITAAGLLSWTGGRRNRPTGLLSRIGDGCHAFATISDMSPLVAQSDRGTRDLLFALLRNVFDGEVTRELGNAPEPLSWRGRLTLLAAATPAIDRFSSHSNALGPRWITIRMPDTDAQLRRQLARQARRNIRESSEHRQRARVNAASLVHAARVRLREVNLESRLEEAIDDMAITACLGRASIERASAGSREILGIPTIEEPPRVTAQLAQLARSLVALGLDSQTVLRVCARTALDSMPQPRRRVLEELALGIAASTNDVAARSSLPRTVARTALEDLEAIGVAAWSGHGEDEPDGRPSRRHKAWGLDGPDTTAITPESSRSLKSQVTREVGCRLTFPTIKGLRRPTPRVTSLSLRHRGSPWHVDARDTSLSRGRMPRSWRASMRCFRPPTTTRTRSTAWPICSTSPRFGVAAPALSAQSSVASTAAGTS